MPRRRHQMASLEFVYFGADGAQVPTLLSASADIVHPHRSARVCKFRVEMPEHNTGTYMPNCIAIFEEERCEQAT